MKKKILLATHNKGKFSDFVSFVADVPYEFVSLKDLGITQDIEETGATFAENALLKATFFHKLTGLPTVADDSGIEVDALGGEPGVYSARYAGKDATDEQKVRFLLKKMEQVPEGKRQAALRTVLAFIRVSGQVTFFEGKVPGMLTREPVGPILPGLPYTCLLYIPEFGKTVAQLKTEKIPYPSQRAETLAKLREALEREGI